MWRGGALDRLMDERHATLVGAAATTLRDAGWEVAIEITYSDDHGVTWSTPAPISGFDTNLCPINYSGAPPGTCDSNQFSDPVVAPNGDVNVVFANYNNCAGALRHFGFDCPGPSSDNHNQMLFVKSTLSAVWCIAIRRPSM